MLHCHRCNQGYECREEDLKYMQTSDCAAKIKQQRELPLQVRIFWCIDGPPAESIILIGDLYLQTFYGSCYDGQYYKILNQNFPWVTLNACICDKCITELLKEGILEYVGQS